MKFKIHTIDYKPVIHDCLIIGINEQGELTPIADHVDPVSKHYIKKLFKEGEIQGKIDQSLILYHVPNCVAERVILVGCGKNQVLTPTEFRKIVINSIKPLRLSKVTHVISFLAELPVKECDLAWKVKQMVELTYETAYVFNQYKSVKEPTLVFQEMIILIEDNTKVTQCNDAVKESLIIAKSVEFTKNLANQPSNICTPTYLAEQAKNLTKDYKNLTVKVLDEDDMKKLGMGAILAVAKGSHEPPKLVCLEYKGSAKNKAPIALVGKGITFDTGGLSLKPADAMVGMKYDMCGAATVLGTIKAAAELKLPLHLVGIVALAENMPSGSATKPEDIITTLSGQTVEIMNTDAEGRLVLADALTYCERYKPATVIDIATLTGAVVIALGIHATGLLSNDETLAKELLVAGNESFDRAWQMPLWEEYQEQLKSPFADMSNVGGRSAGTITAACFLSRFTQKFSWAHLDVAGTAAMMFGNDRYATGRPVPLLVQYLINQTKVK